MQSPSNLSTRALHMLGVNSGLGSFLAASAIVGLSTTITMWQSGLGLSNAEVGVLSAALNFTIAIGSIAAGPLSNAFGMTRVFNGMSVLTVLGFAIGMVAPSFGVLLVSVLLVGLGTGIDLQTSISILTRDAGDATISSKLVTHTQLGWQTGMIGSVCIAFAVSTLGIVGARMLFGIMAVLSIILLLWRVLSKSFAQLHTDAEMRIAQSEMSQAALSQHTRISFAQRFTAANGTLLLPMFGLLMVFYIFWNLVANTWGQFQTFMLVQAHASQSLATGLGIVLYIIMFVANLVVSLTINTRWRNPLFVLGGVVSLASMVAMAAGGGTLWGIVFTTGLMYIGLPLAGEAICKVWTQETFPESSRVLAQGLILGISRLLCGLFALVTPTLVLPGVIGITLWCFVGIVVVFVVAGCAFMMRTRHMNAQQLHNHTIGV